MAEQDMSGQARKGLIDSVKGKAKEVAGAITRNDSLTAEGQLEQTQARERREANSVQAVADAEAEQARTEAAEARKEGARERAAANEKARAAEHNVRNDQAAQKRSAEQAAQRTSEQAKTRAELDAQLEVQRSKAAERDEIDRVSSAGYAVGYIGGGLLLALNLAWILKPEWFGLPSGPNLSGSEKSLPTRLAFLSVAVWWVVFSIPLFRRVPEPPRTREPDEIRGGNVLVVPFVRVAETFQALRGYKQAFLMLLAFMIYNDGIQTIQKMAATYGKELGIADSVLIASILIVQFVGFPFAFLFGAIAARIGAKHAIFIGLVVYAGISILGFYMRSAAHFVLLAALVATVQGGTQALSRSLFASLIPPHKSGEFFGFYSVFEKFASIFGPLLFWITIATTGSSRNAILSVIFFFALGAIVLSRVRVKEGQAAARAADADVVTVAS